MVTPVALAQAVGRPVVEAAGMQSVVEEVVVVVRLREGTVAPAGVWETGRSPETQRRRGKPVEESVVAALWEGRRGPL